MRSRLTWLWPVLVILVFGLPLFAGLGRGDLQTDEAIYSFAVDRILETGDWLVPRSSPVDTAAFLEKPPLKFWIVAAPIRWGLLPHDEFGLRFWDAVFGSLTFLYVFAIGSRLAGWICGIAAVTLLFVHQPLVFEHGFRSNNMDAGLVLCYCGAIYHFLRWGSSETRAAGRHAVAVGVFFAAGFMLKFVAALPLLPVLASACIVVPAYRQRLVRDWRVWTVAAAVSLALIAPWFLYAYATFGAQLWKTMVGEHIVTRFTYYLDPTHVQPWYYYPVRAYEEFSRSNAAFLVIGGLLALSIEAIRRRSAEALVILAWFAVPAAAISMGTSKIYHYFFPFLPPLAIAGGFFVAAIAALLAPPLGRALRNADDWISPRIPRLFERPNVSVALLALSATTFALAVAVFFAGPLRILLGPLGVFRASGVARPLLVALAAGLLGHAARFHGRLLAPLLAGLLLCPPALASSGTLSRLNVDSSKTRSVRDCVLRMETGPAATLPKGLYVDLPDSVLWHPLNYYFRQIRPWTREKYDEFRPLYRHVFEPDEWQPSLVANERYEEFLRRLGPGVRGKLETVAFDEVQLLLPGPYAVCAMDDHASH